MSKAVDDVIVHHPDGMHVRIDDRRADEGEATALQILAHRIGFSGASGDVPYGSTTILYRATVDEPPLIRIEAPELRLHVKKRLGVLYRRFNLGSVADDAGICQQRRDLPLVVAGDLPRAESVEGVPIHLPFPQTHAEP